MSRTSPNPDQTKLLPGDPAAAAAAAAAPSLPSRVVTAAVPARQLSELPREELENLADELGIDPAACKTPQHLVAAIHERRQQVAAMDRDAMLDCVRWGRRPVHEDANKEHLAQEIVRIKSMRFAGLSQRGLVVLATLRGVRIEPRDDVPAIIKKLKKQEGFFARVNRKRRAIIGNLVSNMMGESTPAPDTTAPAPAADAYRFVPHDAASAPPHAKPNGSAPAGPAAGPQPSIRDEIEDSGLFGGLANRIKRSADEYLNQKLDEIEARIDRKLDEIDRRLAEWRDKEIANRIRILKITLWASVIVGAFSLVYSYVKEAWNPTVPTPTAVDHRPPSTRP